MDHQKLVTLLVKHEDLKLKPYTDTVGKLTIGVGHNLTDLGLSVPQVLAILDDDIENVLHFLDLKLPWWRSLDDVRSRALVDMTFNLMGKILEFKKMLAAIQAHDWDGASTHLLDSTFAHQVGQRAIDLAKMFRTGQDA